ncbi:adenosylcobinamide-GDP ribazoletransferase [Desulfobacca acetoxidans]
MIKTLSLALTFLTIIPWPRQATADHQELANSMAWFPLVGLLLGGILSAAALGLSHILPPVAAAALLTALLTIANRGLHLDGLADTLDGLGGGRGREDSLRIMKDHAVGAFGAVGIVLILMVKFSFLAGVLEQKAWWPILIFPVVSRGAMVLLAYLSPYARSEGGLGEAMTTLTSGRTLIFASSSALLIVGLIGSWRGLVSLIAAAAVTILAAIYFWRRLGGVTGDVFGALNEVLEVLVLAVCLIQV